MLLIVACGALLALGIALTVMWSGAAFVPPPAPAGLAPAVDPAAGRPARRTVHAAGLRVYLWWATVFTAIGTATGVLIVGAGGRLVMRLLAAASPEATGGLTEAQASVGDITLGGTLSYLIFGALPAAFLSAALYLVVAPWLPPGRLGGPVFGVVLLVTLSPFLDPLREANFDFSFVGPGWLSVLLFSLLAVLQGAALAAFAARLSRSLPLVSRRRWLGPSAPLLAAVVLFPVGVVIAAGALLALAFPRVLPWLLDVRASRAGIITGRILLGAAVLAALPAFASAVASIVRR